MTNQSCKVVPDGIYSNVIVLSDKRFTINSAKMKEKENYMVIWSAKIVSFWSAKNC